MKWFRHETDARQDFKLKRLQRRFGMEGIGVYWSVIEILAYETKDDFGEEVSLSLDKFPIEDMAADFCIEVDRLKSVLGFMADVGLIDDKSFKENSLCCKSLAKRADDYSSRVARNKKKVRLITGETPANNPLQDITREEHNKTRENITTLWNSTRLPKVLSWSPERKIKLAERLKNPHFREHYADAISRLARSSFALGGGNTGWKADLKWFLHNDDNYLKILEGKYDDKEADPFDKYKYKTPGGVRK